MLMNKIFAVRYLNLNGLDIRCRLHNSLIHIHYSEFDNAGNVWCGGRSTTTTKTAIWMLRVLSERTCENGPVSTISRNGEEPYGETIVFVRFVLDGFFSSSSPRKTFSTVIDFYVRNTRFFIDISFGVVSFEKATIEWNVRRKNPNAYECYGLN